MNKIKKFYEDNSEFIQGAVAAGTVCTLVTYAMLRKDVSGMKIKDIQLLGSTATSEKYLTVWLKNGTTNTYLWMDQ